METIMVTGEVLQIFSSRAVYLDVCFISLLQPTANLVAARARLGPCGLPLNCTVFVTRSTI